MKHSFVLFFLTFLSILCTKAQTGYQYKVIVDDSVKNKTTLAAIRQQYLNDSAAVNGEYKKDYRAMYGDRFKTIKAMFDDGEVIETPQLTAYINSLLAEITEANPEIKALSPRILISRAYWPNAYSMGEGTIVINIGLIHRLANEAQLVFTLCHELSHLYLRHTDQRVNRYITTINSKEYQQRLKAIQKAEYQQRQQAEQLAKQVVFKSRSHSRENETEADAYALELMKKTRFDINHIITTLELLDKVDDEETGVSLQLDKVFGVANYPFQPKWIEKEKSFFGETKTDEKTQKEIDSLKTHPDCQKRIALISPKIKQSALSGQQTFLINEPLFRELQQAFRYEAIEYSYRSKNVSKALFYALLLLQQSPGDLYLQTMVGKCLNDFYTAQKNHELNRITDLPNQLYDEPYNQLLRFIQNVRLMDFAAISYYYLQPLEEKGKTDEEFLYALINSKANYNRQEEKSKWITHYIQYFNNRKYSF